MTDDYAAPTDMWDVDVNLQYEEALNEDDLRYVPTHAARGDFSLTRFFRRLGVDDSEPGHLRLHKPHSRSYTLFCGHRGCGKSTELRRIRTRLHHREAFFVVFLDVLTELDYHNLQYADVFLALAKDLFEALEAVGIDLDGVLLENLELWFSERIETNTQTRDFAAELKAGATGKGGVPFLAQLFVGMTTAIKNNSSYKQELRQIVENSFAQFSQAFNLCIVAAEAALQKAGKGQKVLFLVDGTDRLTGRDSERFFIADVNQLKQIEANIVYCAPIHLLHENTFVYHDFKPFILPMIKLHEKGKTVTLPHGYAALEQMLYKRADKRLFATEQCVEKLIWSSGGNPRELLKLLHYAFLRATGDQFDEALVDAAIQDLAVDYKRVLNTDDYPLLVKIDQTHDAEQNDEQVRYFLYNLLVLEYNSFWRETHPVVKTLAGYKQALAEHEGN